MNVQATEPQIAPATRLVALLEEFKQVADVYCRQVADRGEPLSDPERKELESLREFAGSRCTITKVIESLGPMSLWSEAALDAHIAKQIAAVQPQPAPQCPTCNGNDLDAPCAYPGAGMPGCPREARLKRAAEHSSPAQAVPNSPLPAGWKIDKGAADELVISSLIGGVVVRRRAVAPRTIPEEILHALATALLVANPQPPSRPSKKARAAFLAHNSSPSKVWVAPDADAARLDAFSPGWELSHSWEPEEDKPWQVHLVSGGRNDREWTLIGSGTTPREAIDAAIARPATDAMGRRGCVRW